MAKLSSIVTGVVRVAEESSGAAAVLVCTTAISYVGIFRPIYRNCSFLIGIVDRFRVQVAGEFIGTVLQPPSTEENEKEELSFLLYNFGDFFFNFSSWRINGGRVFKVDSKFAGLGKSLSAFREHNSLHYV
ncbi:hypothetical protein ACH5RR_032296 [Cinchona calisaya]|uniref:Uncharacterized protein n=1 Tax=Cinchona calisaya TaxID=153742 RepID=A0ABD2YKB3_9GENT